MVAIIESTSQSHQYVPRHKVRTILLKLLIFYSESINLQYEYFKIMIISTLAEYQKYIYSNKKILQVKKTLES